MRRAIALLVVLAACGVLAWLLTRDPSRTSDTSGPVRRGDASPPGAPELVGAPPAPRGAEAKKARPETGPARRKAVLRAHVLGDDERPFPGSRVTVLGHHERGKTVPLGKEVAVGPDGWAEVDLDELVAAGVFWGFVVHATHPDGFPAETEIELDDARNREAVVARLERGVELRLRRAAVFDGVVVGARGEPVPAAVQPLVAEETSPEGFHVLAPGGYADAQGRFHVLVAGEGQAALSIAGGPYLITWVPIELRVGTRTDLGTIVLREGEVLAGRVSCPGVARDRIQVLATWYGTKRDGTRLAGAERSWREEGRGVWSQRETSVDADGRFRLEGLEEGAYRLRIPAEDWGAPLHPDAYARVDRIVVSPDDRLEVAADRSLCEVFVEAPREGGVRLLADAVVTFDGEDSVRIRTGLDGLARLVLRSDARHHVLVEAAGFEPRAYDLTAAGPGLVLRQTLRLDRRARGSSGGEPVWTPSSGVLVQAQGPDGVPLAARCRVLDAAGAVIPCRLVEVRPTLQIVSTSRLGVGGPSVVLVDEGLSPAALEIGGDGLGWERRTWPGASRGPSNAPEVLRVALSAGR